ncbi:MAG: hypothetical protein COA79_06305 [Planctomycetota bacterium]|nr:MAG: hypothetical protein COA79_06305 [Planctomycetota bacterium]
MSKKEKNDELEEVKETSTGAQQVPGKGLDVGTANLVCASHDTDGEATIKAIRNAFLDIQVDDYTRNMLTKLNVPFINQNNRFYVIGETAFELANVFNRTTKRPMKDGVISSSEQDALAMEKILVESIVGKPVVPNELVYFSIPADPVDSEMNNVFHKGMFEGMLTNMGYNPKAMTEGHAVILSELGDEEFTGIGISFGGGMVNVCVAFKGVPVIYFSTSRSGDWIDKNAAAVTGLQASRITAIKEKGIDMTNPQGKEQEAIVIYYRNLINYTLAQISNKFASGRDLPQFPKDVTIVCSGGTSMIGGFIDVFKQEFAKLSFPIAVGEIRHAEDPLNAVAYGCLVASMSE